MKIWTSQHVFEHDWATVVKAALQKYPNPQNPCVFGCDVIDRTVTPNGLIKSHRILASTSNIAPKLAKLMNMTETGYCSEYSIIDGRKHTMTLRSRNLTFNRFLNIEENLQYTQHPTSPNQTLLKQEAIINVQNVPLTNYVENLIAKTINTNASKGRLAIEWVIQRMHTAHDPTFSETEQLA